MTDERTFALRCVLFGLEEMRKKLEYTHKPEMLKVYCECIEILAKTYKMIENKQEETNNESN